MNKNGEACKDIGGTLLDVSATVDSLQFIAKIFEPYNSYLYTFNSFTSKLNIFLIKKLKSYIKH